jgi:hypothetical protein
LELITSGLSNNGLVGNISVADCISHQVAAVYYGTSTYLYVDGVLDNSQSATGLLATNTDLITIGSQGGGGSWRWNGDLDETAVFQRGLSDGQITSLYKLAVSGPKAPQITAEPASLAVFAATPAAFTVAAGGGTPYTYRLFRNHLGRFHWRG